MCTAVVSAAEGKRNESTLESFQAEMSLIEQAVSLAQAGDIGRAASVLCTGGDPERTGWRAITAAGKLRERNCYEQAEHLAELILAQPESALARPSVRRKHGRARYWATRLYIEVLDRPEEAEQVLREGDADDSGDPDVAELHHRVRARLESKQQQEGGRK